MGDVEEILLFNTLFRLSIHALVAKIQPDNGAQMLTSCTAFTRRVHITVKSQVSNQHWLMADIVRVTSSVDLTNPMVPVSH